MSSSDSAVAPSSLLQAARTATHDLHQQLEAQPTFINLMKTPLSMTAYTRVLTVLHQVYVQADTLLADLDWPAPYRYQARAHLLHADLIALGEAQSVAQGDILAPDNIASAMGYAYVLEGSSQGARIIYPHITKQLPVDRALGAAYFHCIARAQRSWPAFKSALLTLPDHVRDPTPTLELAFVSGAQYMFEQLLRYTQHLQGEH